MSDSVASNPYQTPSIKHPSERTDPARPIGILIIIALESLFGGLLSFLTCGAALIWDEVNAYLIDTGFVQECGCTPFFAICAIAIFSIFLLVSALGAWRARKWAWWTTYFAALFTMMFYAPRLRHGPISSLPYRNVILIIPALAVILYLSTPRALRYFGFNKSKKILALLIFILISFTLIAAM